MSHFFEIQSVIFISEEKMAASVLNLESLHTKEELFNSFDLIQF